MSDSASDNQYNLVNLDSFVIHLPGADGRMVLLYDRQVLKNQNKLPILPEEKRDVIIQPPGKLSLEKNFLDNSFTKKAFPEGDVSRQVTGNSEDESSEKNWDNNIRAQFRSIAVDLYPDEPSIRRIIQDSGIDGSRVDFHSKSVNTWHCLLIEAEKQGRIHNLVKIVEKEYPTNDKLKHFLKSNNQLFSQDDTGKA